MATNIVRAEREVQDAIERTRRCAEPKETATLVATEAELWSALLGLGRAVIALFLVRHAARPRAATYEHEGVRYALDSEARRKSEIGTRFGKVPFWRAIGRPIGGPSPVDLPFC